MSDLTPRTIDHGTPLWAWPLALFCAGVPTVLASIWFALVLAAAFR